ncbi:MAG: NAD(P)H-binding protein [Armatimonadota bacterium]|nr:NAD(P)H-binding protein [bacterium]
MEKFAFIMHPLSAKRDISRKYPFVKVLPESWIEFALRYKSPMDVSHITGVKSITGVEAEGWFVGCPLTPKLLLELPIEEVWKKIIATAKLAEDHGAKIIGLGAFTSVVGDGGVTVANNVNIAVTTGNSYTVATAIQGSLEGAKLMGIEPNKAHVAVVGATGSIGKTCAHILSKTADSVTLVGRSVDRLDEAASRIAEVAKGTVSTTTDVEQGIKDADIVITVSSAVDAIIEPHFIKRGAVVCDVARPRDVSVRVQQERDDVLVIEGGVVEVPGDDVNLNFNFGFPPKTAYACMSETMMLALDGRYENFTLGKDVSVDQVEQITQIANKHGFKLAGFRSFERAVTSEHIERIRRNAGRG